MTARADDPDPAGPQPAGHLDALLARAGNASALDGAWVAMLRTALVSSTDLHTFHRRRRPSPMSRRTLKHTFLLPDGGIGVLWELEDGTAAGADPVCWVFADRADLFAAELAVEERFGGWRTGSGGAGRAEELIWPGSPSVPDAAGDRDDRRWEQDGSVRHARRLLARAENTDAPGDPGTLCLLSSALAHEITFVTRHGGPSSGSTSTSTWTLYEHAFLLLNGAEVSLWEIEHSMSPDGRPVCEVYATKDAALDTAVRRLEAP